MPCRSAARHRARVPPAAASCGPPAARRQQPRWRIRCRSRTRSPVDWRRLRAWQCSFREGWRLLFPRHDSRGAFHRGTFPMQIPDDSVRAIMRPLVTGKLWLKVLAVAMIFTGAIQALTIIGILWAWLPIWLGVLLFQAAGAAELASQSGDVALAERATDRL